MATSTNKNHEIGKGRMEGKGKGKRYVKVKYWRKEREERLGEKKG